MCSFGDEIVFTQGSVEDLRFAAAFGKNGRIVGAITFNHGKWLEYYGTTHRTLGAVPAAATGLRRAGERRADVGPLPGSARTDRDSRCRSHRP